MSQTVITKYIGPTNTRGSRVTATCWRKSITVSWDYRLGSEENHKEACAELIKALEADSDYNWAIVAHGALPDDSGRAFIICVE